MTSPRRHGIILIERETLLRSSLAWFIHTTDDFQLLGDFPDVADAREGCRLLKPELIIIDVDFGPEESIEFLQVLRKEAPEARVLALSAAQNPQTSFRLAQAQVDGFLAKQESIEFLEEAMREVLSGHRYLPAAFVRDCAKFRERQAESSAELSSKELRILRLVTNGQTSRQIAAQVGLSPRSVETYRSRLMKKVGAANAAGLVDYAFRSGLTRETTEPGS